MHEEVSHVVHLAGFQDCLRHTCPVSATGYMEVPSFSSTRAPAVRHSSFPSRITSIPERAFMYWRCTHEAVMSSAARIHAFEVEMKYGQRPQTTIVERLLQTFLVLPTTPPTPYSAFGLSAQQLMETEIALMQTRCYELAQSTHDVEAAWLAPLDVAGLCPFPVAVACCLATHSNIAPEAVFGMWYAFGGWVLHRDLHATLTPHREDRRTRPRVMVQGIAGPSSGKSPFYRSWITQFLLGVDGKKSVLTTHKGMFADADKKGLYIAAATDSDFAHRMQASGGYLLWASPENYLLLDHAHAMKNAENNERKVNYHALLECQNGNDFGPRSTKNGPQVHVPTTNFGMFHLGQAACIHDYWGQTFNPKSIIRNLGMEGRPTFLFPGKTLTSKKSISADLGATFCHAVLLNMALHVGHYADHHDLVRHPIVPVGSIGGEAAGLWETFSTATDEMAEELGRSKGAQIALEKHGYTSGSHVILNHLFVCSLQTLPRTAHGLEMLLNGGAPLFSQGPPPLQRKWFELPTDALLTAPRHIHMMASNLVTIFNEMELPVHRRAGNRDMHPVESGEITQLHATPPHTIRTNTSIISIAITVIFICFTTIGDHYPPCFSCFYPLTFAFVLLFLFAVTPMIPISSK